MEKKKDKQLCTNTAQMRKIEQHRLHKKSWVCTQVLRKGKSIACTTSDSHHVTAR